MVTAGTLVTIIVLLFLFTFFFVFSIVLELSKKTVEGKDSVKSHSQEAGSGSSSNTKKTKGSFRSKRSRF